MGVKGHLSSQELEQLRNQLAQAAAYAHIPAQQRSARVARTQGNSKPMTKIYRRLESQDGKTNLSRSCRKSLGSIQYEHKFCAQAYDSLKPRSTRGIGMEAKTILQDEYVVNPRHVSYIPQSLLSTKSRQGSESDNQILSGKRRGNPEIPQVFIM